MNRRAIAKLLLAAMVIAAPLVQAQTPSLVDPTRPPGANAWTGAQDEVPAAGKQLQSVLLSGGRRLAVIDGTMVPLGGMLGDARVVKITESEVVLKTGEETETLKLFPGIDKQPVKRAARRVRAGAPAEGSAVLGGPK